MNNEIPEKTEKGHSQFLELKKTWIFWKKLISMHKQLKTSNWQLSPCEFSKARSFILRPEMFGIVIWSKFQLEVC